MAYPPIIQHPVSAIRETLRSDPTRSHITWHDSIDGGSRIPDQPDLATTAPTPPTRLWKMRPYGRKPGDSDLQREVRKTFTGQAPKREGAMGLKVEAQNSQTQLKTVHGAGGSRQLDPPPSIISPPYHVGIKTNPRNDRVMSPNCFRNKASVLKRSVCSDSTYTHSCLRDHRHDTQGAFKTRDRLNSVVAPATEHLGNVTPSESSAKRSSKLQHRVDYPGNFSSIKMEEGSAKFRRKPSPQALDLSDNTNVRPNDAYLVMAGTTLPSWRRDLPGGLPYQRNQDVTHEQLRGRYASAHEEVIRERNSIDVLSRSVACQQYTDDHNGADNEATSSSLSDEDVSDYEPDITSSSVIEQDATTSDLEAEDNENTARNISTRGRSTTKGRNNPTAGFGRNSKDNKRTTVQLHTESLASSESETSASSLESQPHSAAEEDAARLRQEEEDRLLAIQIAKEDYNLRRPRQQAVRRREEPTQEGRRGGRSSRRTE